MPTDRIDRPNERRQYRRVRVNFVGRYMLANDAEYGCRVQDISLGGLALMAIAPGRVGERVIAYIDNVGRVEGTIIRILPIGFAMIMVATERGRDRIARKLACVANEQILPEIIS
jgi:hypothetical protein